MNLKQLQNAINHLAKTCKCLNCNKKHKTDDIHVLATTNMEGLLEMKCQNCNSSSLVTILLTPEIEIKEQSNSRTHKGISKNDILDFKNFLNDFDGNFKKLFSNKFSK